MNAAAAWRMLVDEGKSAPGWHAIRVAPSAPCDIQVAIRQPDACLAVLVHVPARLIPPGIVYPECVGFALTPEPVQTGPNGSVRLCLELRDRAYSQLFEALAEDVIAVVSEAADDGEGVRALLGRLNTWQRFASRFGPGLLPEETRLGLFAELRFLATYLLDRLPAVIAVDAWRGPLGEAHDFRLGTLSVEIKASSAAVPSTVSISSLDQLDSIDTRVLLLNHATISSGGTSTSLPDFVDSVRDSIRALDVAACADFDARLREVGYFDVHAEAYATPTYFVTKERWFRVTQGFPRLVRGMIPLGISSASYSVELDACHPFEQTAAESAHLLKEMWG